MLKVHSRGQFGVRDRCNVAQDGFFMTTFSQKIKFFSFAVLFFVACFLFGFSVVRGANTDLTVDIFNPQCGDTLDNDSDGFADLADPDCFSVLDDSEATYPQCGDGGDNDSDGLVDYPADPGCSSAADVNENFQCNDGLDNDSDTFIDLLDPDCSSSSDDDETHHGGSPPPGDTELPYIVAFTPANNSTGVSSTTPVSVTFDNTVVKQSGNILIKETPSNNIFDSIPVLGARVTLTSGRILSMEPISRFSEGMSYYMELPAGMVLDEAGNSFAGITGPSGWKFSVKDETPPTIGNVSISPNKNVATLSWNTNEPTSSAYFWGTTTAYTAGSGADASFSTTHIVILGSLLSGTLYHYKIDAKDSSDNVSEFTGTFTTLTEDDTTPTANPSGFGATPDINFIKLAWSNPDDADFLSVRIMRSDESYPLSPASGDFVYEGTGIKTDDVGVLIGVKYYYAIFAKDTSGNYSSGSLSSAKIPLPEPPIEPPIEPPVEPPVVPPVVIPPPPVSGGGGESGGGATTTVSLPPPSVTPPVEFPAKEETIDTSVKNLFPLAFSDFNFYEQGETDIKIYVKNDSIDADSNKNMRISVPDAKLPSDSLSVILKIKNLEGEKEVSSFLLSERGKTNRREAILDLHGAFGSYPVTIDVFGQDNKLLARVFGTFKLEPKNAPLVTFLTPELTEQITTVAENISPSVVPLGIAVGASQTIVLAGNVGSFYDLYLLLLKFFGIIAGFFRRKKSKPWGVVYDSVTKQPIDPAYVVVEDIKGEKKKKTAITDLDGRYGFLIEPGTYSLVANKTHYKFPSEKLSGREHDEMYENLYFGSLFDIKEDKVLLYNIPLDPMEFDWNEFAKNKDHIFNMYSRREKARMLFFSGIFFIGFGISVVATLFSPTRINLAIFALYILVTVWKAVWKYKHHVTRLLYADGRPISFAIVSAEVSGISIPVIKKVTTDMLGRFYLLTSPGVYDIKVQEKQDDGTYREIYNKKSVDLKRGVLTKDIIIER